MNAGSHNNLFGILEHMLNAVYVVDLDAEKLLFCNRSMRRLFGWGEDVAGQSIPGIKFPEAYASEPRLLDLDGLWAACKEGAEDLRIVCAQTGRNYKVTVQAIDLEDTGRYLLYTIADVTELVSEEIQAKQRGELVSEISQLLVTEKESKTAINKAIEMIGEFFDADRVFVSQFDSEYNQMEFIYGWERPERQFMSIFDYTVTDPGPFYKEMVFKHQDAFCLVDNVMELVKSDTGLQVASEYDVKSLLCYPIVLSGRLWGVLELNMCVEPHRWSTGDIELGKYLSRIISVYISRQVMEPELQRKNKIISTIMDNVLSGVFWKNLDSVYQGCNKNFERFLGYTNEEIVGRHDSEFLPAGYLKKHIDYEKYLYISGTGRISYTMKLEDSNGDTVLIAVKKALIYDDKTGDALFIVGVYENIGDNYLLETPRNDVSHPNVLRFIDIIDNPIFLAKTDGGFDIRRSGKFTFAGYTQDELDGKNILDFFMPKDILALEDILDEIKENPAFGRNFTGRVTAKDGKRLDYKLEFYPLRSRSNRLRSIQITYADLTEQREMERQIERMTKIVNKTPLIVGIYDTENRGLYYNPAVEAITGYSREKAMEGGFQLLYDEEMIRYLNHSIIPELQKTGVANFDAEIRRIDGEKRTISHTCFNVDEDGIEIGAIAMDITESIRMQQELLHAKNQAEQASQAKGEFLSRMSHEIRTPLNAIIGMTNIGLSSDSMDKKVYCFEQISNASGHLLGIVNDILDMSKIEANKFEVSVHEFNLETMLMNVANVINFKAEEKDQTFIVSIDKNLPINIVSDELRLSQVITNLLSNAVKFTPEKGLIMLSVFNEHHEGDRYTLRFEVYDNGIGISEQDQKKLFRSFEQADGSVARKYGGTGLGLAISKRIIELMGGRIWVESDPGKGSKFIFSLTCDRGRKTPPPGLHPHINREKLRVLVADDSADIRNYFVKLMEALKLPCDVAGDGFEALEMFADAMSTKPYNIIFVDWQMPRMDGIELTKRIKQISANNIVIMISVANHDDLEEKALQAGIDRILPKPIFPSMLINAVNESLGLVTVADKMQEKNEAHDFRGHVLLLAEDVPINREIVKTYLEDTGVEIDNAENGVEALNLFQQNPDRYSAILMDIHMPDMDGYEATRKIRQLPDAPAKTIPIVAMTANVFREDIEKCMEVGMDDHIGKPVNITDLRDKLSAYLPAKAEPTPERPVRPPDMDEAAAPQPAQDADISDYINLEQGLERTANIRSIYIKLLKDFDGAALHRDLRESLDGDDMVRLQKSAHAAKGVAANLAFPELYRLALEIEDRAKAGKDTAHLRESVETAFENLKRARDRILLREGEA